MNFFKSLIIMTTSLTCLSSFAFNVGDHGPSNLLQEVNECSLEQMLPSLKAEIKPIIKQVMGLQKINYNEDSIKLEIQDNNQLKVTFKTERNSLIQLVNAESFQDFQREEFLPFSLGSYKTRDNEGFVIKNICTAELKSDVSFINKDKANYLVGFTYGGTDTKALIQE